MAGREVAFSDADYAVFGLTLGVSLAVGAWFAWHGRHKGVNDYLIGGGQLGTVPVIISMVVTIVSALAVLGNPVEVYLYGLQYVLYVLAVLLGALGTSVTFTPLYRSLGLTTVTEYFRLRFDSHAFEVVVTVLMIFTTTIACGMMLMAACISLPAVSTIPLWASIVLAGSTATVYTAMGGMRAVIWTDVVQAVIMVGGLLAIVIMGTLSVGGASEVWEINKQYGRINFGNFDPSPSSRESVWSVVVFNSVSWFGIFTTQASIQRLNSIKSHTGAQLSMVLAVPGVVGVAALTCGSGAVAFAYYAAGGCDPVAARRISPNQILPYFVTDVLDVPGIPGLFIACVFSASLSSVSSMLGSLGALTWENILKYNTKMSALSPVKQTTVIKIVVVVFGIASIGVTYLATNLSGTILQMSMGVVSSFSAPITGMICAAASFRHLSLIGAAVSGVCAFVPVLWMAVGSNIYAANPPPLPSPTNCSPPQPPPDFFTNPNDVTFIGTTPWTPNTTSLPSENGGVSEGLMQFYSVNFMWYSAISLGIALLVGAITTVIPGLRQKVPTPDHLLFPFARRRCCCCDEKDETSYLNEGLQDKPEHLKYGGDIEHKNSTCL